MTMKLFSKKNSDQSTTEPAGKISKKPLKTPIETNGVGSKKIDGKKLVLILAVLLIVVLGALVAKLFLFNDETTNVAENIAPPVITEPAPSETDVVVADETDTATAETETVPAEQTAMEALPANDTNAIDTVTVPENSPTDSSLASPDNQTPITKEDFIKESQNKVYRERVTEPSQTN